MIGIQHMTQAAGAEGARLSQGGEAPGGALFPDPVFVLIEEHRAAYAAWAAEAVDGPALADGAGSRARHMGDQERAALSALMVARPTTLAGVLALAEYLPGAIRQVAVDDEGDGERALRTIAAALRGLVPAPCAAVAPDPVLAAIAASRKAQAEMEAFNAGPGDQSRVAPAEHARERLLSAAQVAADMTVWSTVPTTQAGRRALVDYARFQARVRTTPAGDIDDAEGFLRTVLKAFSAAITAGPAPDADEVHAHALVEAIERVWAEDAHRREADRQDAGPEADARHDAMLRQRDALIVTATQISAATRAGRYAKALSLAWLDHAELWREGCPRSGYGTDGRLLFDIDAALVARGEPGVHA